MEIIILVILALATYLSRVINLLAIPIFTDEAIYIRWAQIGLADPAHRYISLTDGKQPLMTWLMYPMLKIFSDPLFAGRIVSVLSGVMAVVGMYFLGKMLFGKKGALVSGILYLISPFFLLYDRFALMDSLLASIGVWSLYLEILLVKTLRLDIALILGMVLGMGLMTKSSAQFYIYLLPFSLIFFNFKKKNWPTKLARWIVLVLISVFISQVMFNSLRLSPWFYIIEQKNHVFIRTLSELADSRLQTFLPNLNGLFRMLITYLTFPVFLSVLIGIYIMIREKKKEILYLLTAFIFPFMALAVFGKILFPRFILFMTVPLLPVAAYTLIRILGFAKKKRKWLLLVIPAVFALPLYQSFLLIFSPIHAPIHEIDRNQFFDDWPSGYGAKEVVKYVGEKAEDQKVVLGTEGTFGLNPAVYEIYLGGNSNIEIMGFWPVSKVPDVLMESAKKYPTYLVFKESQEIPKLWPLTLIEKYPRGRGDTYLLFYQVDPGGEL